MAHGCVHFSPVHNFHRFFSERRRREKIICFIFLWRLASNHCNLRLRVNLSDFSHESAKIGHTIRTDSTERALVYAVKDSDRKSYFSAETRWSSLFNHNGFTVDSHNFLSSIIVSLFWLMSNSCWMWKTKNNSEQVKSWRKRTRMRCAKYEQRDKHREPLGKPHTKFGFCVL